MNTQAWRKVAAKGATIIGSVVGVTALVGVVLVLPLKAQQDAAAAQSTPDTQQMCASNMKQVALGVLQYTEDYDESYPSGTSPAPNGATTGVGWAGQVVPYMNTGRRFQCPADKTNSVRPQFTISYGLNSNVVRQYVASATDPGYSVLLFEVRGDRVLLRAPNEGAGSGATVFSSVGDGTDGGLLARAGGLPARSVVYTTGVLGSRTLLSPPGQFVEPRHAGGANFALLDGHVECHPASDVSSGSNAPTLETPQTGGVRGTAAGVDDNQFAITFSMR